MRHTKNLLFNVQRFRDVLFVTLVFIRNFFRQYVWSPSCICVLQINSIQSWRPLNKPNSEVTNPRMEVTISSSTYIEFFANQISVSFGTTGFAKIVLFFKAFNREGYVSSIPWCEKKIFWIRICWSVDL